MNGAEEKDGGKDTKKKDTINSKRCIHNKIFTDTETIPEEELKNEIEAVDQENEYDSELEDLLIEDDDDNNDDGEQNIPRKKRKITVCARFSNESIAFIRNSMKRIQTLSCLFPPFIKIFRSLF